VPVVIWIFPYIPCEDIRDMDFTLVLWFVIASEEKPRLVATVTVAAVIFENNVV
jgi:hypothetical protein